MHTLYTINITRDEIPVSRKMDGFSALDGFMEITECLAEIIKYLANEPSVGLFYVQRHVQSTVPNLVKLKSNVKGKSHELTLQTEDSEDSITMIRSMKDCGFPIIDEMVKDITKSLAIMSAKEPRKGLINNSNSWFQQERTSSWSSAMCRKTDFPPQDSKRTSNYFTTVLKSTQGSSSNLNYPQLYPSEFNQPKDEKLPSYLSPALPYAAATASSTGIEFEELPLSCPIVEELQEEESQIVGNLTNGKLSSTSDNFDTFRADRKAKLEEWLDGTNNNGCHIGQTSTDNPTIHSDAGKAWACK